MCVVCVLHCLTGADNPTQQSQGEAQLLLRNHTLNLSDCSAELHCTIYCMYICMCLLLQLFRLRKICVVVIIEPHSLTVDSLIEILCFARANLYTKIFVESLQPE